MYLLIIGIILGVIYAIVEMKSAKAGDTSVNQAASRGTVTADRESQIRQLILDGYHSKAVKAYADAYRVPFDTAMQAIDRMQEELASGSSEEVRVRHDDTQKNSGANDSIEIDDALREQLHELDGFVETLELLPDHLGQRLKEDILASLHQGRKVQSIQLYQQSTGTSLKDGKVVIDEIMDSDAFKRFERREPCGTVAVTHETFSDSEVTSLIQKGRKIQAIKRIRELRGCGLKEGKEIADAIEKHGVYESRNARVMDQNDTESFEELLRSGKTIQAIKVYRTMTGCSLKEAKEYVDARRMEL